MGTSKQLPGIMAGPMREVQSEKDQKREARAEGTNLRRREGVVKSPRKRDRQGERGHQRRAQGGEGTLPPPPLKPVVEGLVVGRRSTLTKLIKTPSLVNLKKGNHLMPLIV